MPLLSILLRQSKLQLMLAILAGVAAGMFSSLVLAIVNENLDSIGRIPGRVGYVFLGLAFAAVAAKLTSRLLLLRLSTRTVRTLRTNLCAQILKTPLREVERNGPSALMATLTQDVTSVADALVALPEQCGNAAIATACFAYLFWLSWPLGLAYVAIFAFGIVIYRLFSRQAQPAMAAARQTWDLLIENYNGLIHGNKELKLHRARRAAFDAERVRPTIVTMMNHSWRWNWILAIAGANTQLVFFMLLGVALFVAPRFQVSDPTVLSGFILMSLYMGGPISSIVGSLPQFAQARVALKKIESLGLSLAEAPNHDLQPAPAEGAAEPFRLIEAEGLEYHYTPVGEETAFSLGPIDLQIKAGEALFIVGGNGSGKSSFARVLTGLYTPSAGRLRLNGREVVDANRDDFRQRFAAVFSDYHLFRNLYGLSGDASIEQAQRYLDRLQLSSKVTIDDGQLSTLDLSQGQRKRLALLTAFLEDRDIFLFDEWAADQDPVFKRVFYLEILPYLKSRGRTLVVITHDDQYFHLADRIVRFTDGRVLGVRSVDDPAALAAEPV